MLQSVDIFFFNDDALRRLDSYQRFGPVSAPSVTASSRKGRKIAVAVANLPDAEYRWNEISSYDALSQKFALLENEDPQHPVMTGTCTVEAGTAPRCSLTLTPLLSEVRIHSICCDFHGKPYAGQRLERAKAYLIHVSSAERMLGQPSGAPSLWLNCGRLNEADMSRMQHPEMVSAEISGGVGSETRFPDLALYCYPNEPEEETIGHPCTRLVIEGEIEGRTYYYPVNLSCPRNVSSSLDISITLLGTDDPDCPASSGAVRVAATVAAWNEKNDVKIRF